MSKNSKTDQTTRAVPCLVALLFSLAVIADWAACAPAPIRYAVMLILRRAEAIAYSHIYWELHGHGLTLQWALPHGCRTYSDPEDAFLFGWWFRVLAIALRDLPRRVFFQKHRRLTSPSPRSSRGEGAGEGLFPPPCEEDVGQADGWGGLRQRGPPLVLS
jgi:hypothetical protein